VAPFPRRAARLLLVALVAFAALGAPAAGQTRTISTADEMAAFMFGHLNQFWFMAFFGNDAVDYDLMLEYHIYENETDWIPMHRCPIRLGEDNAAYCHPEQAIFMDRDLLERGMAEYGVEVVAISMAHEWGHHIQYILAPDALEAALVSGRVKPWELMADCIAGAEIRPLVENGMFNADNLSNMRGFLASTGDDAVSGIPNLSDSHGSSAERLTAFDRGLKGGASVCAG